MTSCAIRSPRLKLTDRSRSVFSSVTLISPRQPASTVPGALTSVTPCLAAAEDVDLAPGERALVRTGLAIALPAGYAAFVHPRSGLAASYGVTLVNAPGTIDAGYRGEIKVILLNTDPARQVSLRRGDRIAQLVVQRVEYATFREVAALPGSARGEGGFGSTGGHAGPAPADAAAAE